jgi:hypothetical protein
VADFILFGGAENGASNDAVALALPWLCEWFSSVVGGLVTRPAMIHQLLLADRRTMQ